MESSLQTLFFQHIKASIPPHLSMVDEIAGLLDISNDSAYRRIRGEKPIDLEEVRKLASHFKISVDKLLHLESDAFVFTGNLKDGSEESFTDWLKNVLQLLQWLNSFKNKHIYFLIKDIPPFLHFQLPELAAFKFFFWMKAILHYENFKGVKFRLDDPRYQEFHILSNKVIDLYNSLPITEIWNIESINSSLRQIKFFHEAGAFANPEEVRILYMKMEELVNHIERQAELGVRFPFGQRPIAHSPKYRLFVNELILGDNTFMVEIDNVRTTFLNHSVLYFVATRDERFNNAMFDNLENLMKKSTLVSGVGEKERNIFFNRIRQSIHAHVASV